MSKYGIFSQNAGCFLVLESKAWNHFVPHVTTKSGEGSFRHKILARKIVFGTQNFPRSYFFVLYWLINVVTTGSFKELDRIEDIGHPIKNKTQNASANSHVYYE